MTRRRDVIVAEFTVTVWASRIDWGGLDAFLWWLMHRKAEGAGFRPHARMINALDRRESRLVPPK